MEYKHKCEACNKEVRGDLISHSYPELPYKDIWLCESCFNKLERGIEIFENSQIVIKKILIAIAKTPRTMKNFLKKNLNFEERYDIIRECYNLDEVKKEKDCDWVVYDYPEDYNNIKDYLRDTPGYRRLKPKEYKW